MLHDKVKDTIKLKEIIISCIKDGLAKHEQSSEELIVYEDETHNIDCLLPSELLQIFSKNNIDDSWMICYYSDKVVLYREKKVPASTEEKKKHLYNSSFLYNKIHNYLVKQVQSGICEWLPSNHDEYKCILASDLYTDIKNENYSNILNYFENRIKLK